MNDVPDHLRALLEAGVEPPREPMMPGDRAIVGAMIAAVIAFWLAVLGLLL